VLITFHSSQSVEPLLLMEGINQFAINPREIDIFLGPLSQSELIDKICHSPYPLYKKSSSSTLAANYISIA
jgi:hypothetical protein